MIIKNVINENNKIILEFDNEKIEVSINCWARNYLRKDMDLSDEEINKIKLESRMDLLIEDGLKSLKQMKTEYEIYQYFLKKDSLIADEVLKYFKKRGYVDDLKYAKNYILINKNKKGSKLIEYEMKEKHIDEEIISEALKNYSMEEENDLLEKLIIKELELYKSGSINQFIQKITDKMIKKGFIPLNIKKIVEEDAKILDNIDEGYSLLKDYEIIKRRFEKKYHGHELDNKIMTSLYSKGYKIDDIRKVRGDYYDGKEN